MAANPHIQIPVLTDEIADEVDPDLDITLDEPVEISERETLIAELQTQLASGAFELTDKIMRKAFAEMEASIFEQISSRLRQELPEMIDSLLRSRLDDDTDN